MTLLLVSLLGCDGDGRKPDGPGSGRVDSAVDTDLPAPPTDTGSPPTDTDGSLAFTSQQVLPVQRMVTSARITLVTNAPATVSVRCTSADHPEEDHRPPPTAAGTEHLVAIDGLLPDAAYQCAATATAGAEDATAEVPVVTAPLPFAPIAITATSTPGAPGEGAYTVLTHWSDVMPHQVLVVDWDGRVRWYWEIDSRAGTGVEAAIVPDGDLLVGGGFRRGLAPRFLSPSAEELWVGPPPSNGDVYHHDVDLIPGSRLLTLAKDPNTDGISNWEGFLVEILDVATSEALWTWRSQRAVDEGLLPPWAPGRSRDLYHANSVQWLDDADGEGVLVSLPGLDAVFRLAHPSGAILWRLGKNGDFVLQEPDGTPILDEDEWFSFQHSPTLEPDGTMLIHDNGSGRSNPHSRAVALRLDTAAHTATMTWKYREPEWYEPLYGSIDRVAGGHVLVGQGHEARFDRDTAFRSAVIQVDPATDETVHAIRFGAEDSAIYRAHRIDGCALFTNRAYCAAP